MIPTRSIEGISFPDYSRIEIQDWPRLMEEAIAQALRDQQEIADNVAQPTFENTFEALERRSTRLGGTTMAFTCLSGAHATDELLALSEEWLPKIAAMEAALLQDAVLFQRCRHAYDSRENWDPIQERLAVDTLDSFIKSGAALDERDRKRFLEIAEQLEKLSIEVQDKINEASRLELILEASDLAGMEPAFLVEAATGREDGKFAVRPIGSIVDTVLANCEIRDTREKIFRLFTTRNMGGDTDTSDLIAQQLRLGLEMAKMLGFDRYSDLIIDGYMAKTPGAVNTLIQETWDKIQPAIERDLLIVSEIAAQAGIEKLEAWDVPFFTEAVRKRDHSIDNAQVSAYLPLGPIQQAAFETAEKLFGIRLEKSDAPTYHEDCVAWIARDIASGEAIGGLITDYRTRATKGPGAWMDQISVQHSLDGGQKPIVINVCSFGQGENLDEARLSLDDANTLFHELGHALHGLLSKVRYPSQSGTNVLHDWVELPSQLLENWIISEEGLLANTKHANTGEPMTAEFAHKITAAQRFGQTFAKAAYLQSAMLDMAIHSLEDENTPADLTAFSQEVLDKVGASSLLPPRHQLAHFSHLFAGGYAAGYYGYLWAEVMEAEVFNLFKERGLFDADTALEVRNKIYAIGNEVDPAELFRSLIGRDPKPDALMEKIGAPTSKPKTPAFS